MLGPKLLKRSSFPCCKSSLSLFFSSVSVRGFAQGGIQGGKNSRGGGRGENLEGGGQGESPLSPLQGGTGGDVPPWIGEADPVTPLDSPPGSDPSGNTGEDGMILGPNQQI